MSLSVCLHVVKTAWDFCTINLVFSSYLFSGLDFLSCRSLHVARTELYQFFKVAQVVKFFTNDISIYKT